MHNLKKKSKEKSKLYFFTDNNYIQYLKKFSMSPNQLKYSLRHSLIRIKDVKVRAVEVCCMQYGKLPERIWL